MLTARDSTAAPNTQLERAHGVPCTGGGSSSWPVCHLPLPKPTEDVTETRAEAKRQRETESAQSLTAVNDLEIPPVNVWLYSQARAHGDAFLSHEILFLKYHSCTLRLHRINKICSRQIYLCLQEALSCFWILDHLWLSIAPSFCSAVQGLQSL